MWPVVFQLKLAHDLLNVRISEGCKLPGGIIRWPQHSRQVRKVAAMLMSIGLAQLAPNRCCQLSAATNEGRAHGPAACHCGHSNQQW